MRGQFSGPDVPEGRPAGVLWMLRLHSRCRGYDAHAAAVVVVTSAVFVLRGFGDGCRRAAAVSTKFVRIKRTTGVAWDATHEGRDSKSCGCSTVIASGEGDCEPIEDQQIAV